MQVNQADLAHCAQERIEIPECVQPFGGLLVCDPSSSRILRYSAGACRLLRCEDLLGQCLTDLIPLLLAHWQRLSEQPPLAPVRINHLSLGVKTLDVLVHAVPAQAVWVVELFPAHDPQDTYLLESALFEQMSDAIDRMRALPSLNDFWTRSSDLLRTVLGYERVMIYRFDADGSGQVIAESTAEGVPVKYLHLHFPGSDIPAQARVLYERNLLRVIADVDGEPEPLLGDATEPLDQSLCLLRQPSPLHLQYLRNMGVRATLTVSLLQDGKLWGMLACHHPVPRVPPQHLSRGLLVACNLLGLAFNIHLSSLLRIEQLHEDKALAEQLEALAKRLNKLEDWAQWREAISGFLSQQLPLAQLDVSPLPATTNVTLQRGVDTSQPPHDAWLRVPGGRGFDGFAIHLVKTPDDTARMWAGDPSEHEPIALKDGQVVLGPRESFEIWREQRARHPLPWTESERVCLQRTQRLLHELLQQRLVRLQEEQLAVLGAALEQSREMIIVSTADKDTATGVRRIVYVNEALLAGTLYTRDELIGRSPSLFQGPETDPLVVQRISRQLAAGEPVVETLRNYKKNGQPHWLDLRIHPLRNAVGQITHFVSVQRDVTQQLESLAQLHQQHAFLTRLTELLPGAVYVYRRSVRREYSFDFTTEVFQSLFGIESSQPSQSEIGTVIHPDDLPAVLDSIERSAQTLSRWRQRFRVRSVAGQGFRTLEGLSDPTREDDGTVIWFGIIFDVTEQVEVEMALNEALIEHQATLDAIPEQLLEIDGTGQISNAHARDGAILGRAASELVSRRLMDVMPEHVAHQFLRAIREAQVDGVSEAHEVAVELAGRTEYRSLTVVKKQSTAHQDNLATGTLFIASLSDITERKLAEDRVRHLVNHDELTQLLNRRGFQERLQFVHQQARRRHTAYAVLFIDLDHFKHLNDSLGHQAGDLALTHVAARLTQHTRSSDVVARLGGDEFVVLLLGATQDAVAEESRWLATKLITELSKPLSLADTPFNLTCSVGIALSDTTTPESQDILRWADLAMYSAKESGRNGIKFFDERIQQVMLHRVRIEQDLRVALSNQSLALYAQPIVDERGATLGHEVLLRWTRPGLGPVSPVEFIPVAEQTGLIVPIGQWVLETVCQRLVRWASDPMLQRQFLAVNISAAQIKQADFVERLRNTIASTGAPAHLLKLELTESLLHEDVDATIRKLYELRELGVRLSLDDFGTGYSSLAYLRKLPIQELKIDRSFVLHALDVPDDAAVARMIVQLAQTLRLDVVAEGVETQEQLIFLRGIGCQKFQGYMFGKPGPLD